MNQLQMLEEDPGGTSLEYKFTVVFYTGTQQLLNDMGKNYRYSFESPTCVYVATLVTVKLHAGRRSSYCAFVRLLSCVSAHVDYQHVLGLEGLLLP